MGVYRRFMVSPRSAMFSKKQVTAASPSDRSPALADAASETRRVSRNANRSPKSPASPCCRRCCTTWESDARIPQGGQSSAPKVAKLAQEIGFAEPGRNDEDAPAEADLRLSHRRNRLQARVVAKRPGMSPERCPVEDAARHFRIIRE